MELPANGTIFDRVVDPVRVDVEVTAAPVSDDVEPALGDRPPDQVREGERIVLVFFIRLPDQGPTW